MALRYIDSPDIDVGKTLPRSEMLISGVQQAQQRHDNAQAAWQEQANAVLDRGFANAEGREAYLQQQQQLFDETITRNQGNLASGYEDMLGAVRKDKANPYHNLNSMQLKEVAREQKLADTYGDKAVILSNEGKGVMNANLVDPATGQWVTDYSNIQANVIESPDYEKEADFVVKSLINDLVDNNEAKKHFEDTFGYELSGDTLDLLSKDKIDWFIDNYGKDAFLGQVGGIISKDNSVNAAFDPGTGANQFQSTDEDGKVFTDEEKVKKFIKAQAMDKINIRQGFKPERQRNVTNVNVATGSPTTPEQENIALESTLNADKFGIKELNAIQENIPKVDKDIEDIQSNIDDNIKDLNSFNIQANNISDLIALQNSDTYGSLPDEQRALVKKVGDQVLSLEKEQYKKDKYERIYGLGVDKAVNAIDSNVLKKAYSSYLEKYDRDYKGTIDPPKKIEDIKEYKELVKTTLRPGNEYSEGDWQNMVVDDELRKEVTKQLENVKFDRTNRYVTNTDKDSPEAIHVASLDKAAGTNRLDYTRRNFTTENGETIFDLPIGYGIEGGIRGDGSPFTEKDADKYDKGLGEPRTLQNWMDEYNLTDKDIEVKYHKPSSHEGQEGFTTHISIIDKANGKPILQIPHAQHGDTEFNQQNAAQQLSNSLQTYSSKNYNKKYLTRSLINYGAAHNSNNVERAAAKYTAPGENTKVNLLTGSGRKMPVFVNAYNVGNSDELRYKILDINGNSLGEDITDKDLNNNLYIIAGKLSVENDTNFSSLLANKSELSNTIKGLSPVKYNNIKNF